MKRLLYMALAAGVFGAAIASPPADVTQRIRQFEQGLVPAVLIAGEPVTLKPLAARMAELNVPGVSLAVIHQGRIDWAKGYGVTRRNGPPVTENTLFQAASISKPVFALAALHLVDEGKLALDANVNEYLKSWKVPDNEFTAEQKVTLRRLLSHSAGLTVHGFPGYTAGAALPTTPQILDGAAPANTGPIRVDLVPGTQIRYSGGGYTVAQLLLTDVTGSPLPKLLQDSVLKPLGMTRSTYEQPLPATRLDEVALPYRADGSAVTGGPHSYPEMAAAGLWTTPSDLARYALGVREALAGHSKIISAATARLMLTPVMDNQGLGPQVGGDTSRKFFMHNGGNEGYRCVLVMYEDGEGAAVMTSGDNGGGLMYEVLRAIAGVYEWPEFGPVRRTLANVKPETLERLIGVYEMEDQSLYVVRRDGDRLVGYRIGNDPVAMLPSSDVELFARDSDIAVTFVPDAKGAITALTFRMYGQGRPGTRVAEPRAGKVMAAVARDVQRTKDQKRDPRTEPALRKLIAGVTSGKPDYDSLSPPLAKLTREQLKGFTEWFVGLGAVQSVKFQRVTGSGADEYLVTFAKGRLRIDVGLDADDRVDKVYFEPR